MTRTSTAASASTAVALAETLGLATVCWAVTVRRMSGMDMGVTTHLGSFAFFVALWVPMMAAMMLPGAVPAALRRARDDGGALAVSSFVAGYLAVWALVGVAAYVLYRPHGSVAAGVLVVAAGAYEVTPVKRCFRQRCREDVRSGFEFGVHCVGSSAGLMVTLAALGVMSVTWMALTAVPVLAQKLLPAKTVLDVPLALAIAGLGVWILVDPSSIPGLVPSM